MRSAILLDGGMGSELIDRGAATKYGMWSAAALIDAPEVVQDVHRSYIAAGSDVITTNTYSTIPSYLEKQSQLHSYIELAEKAAMLARQVAIESDRNIKVAASIPPLSESYRPDLVLDASTATPIYENLAKAVSPHVDWFLCETMSSIEEAQIAVRAISNVMNQEVPVLVSFTLHEEPGRGLRSEESLEQAVAAATELNISGLLFNCTTPEAIETAVTRTRSLSSIPVGGYPNRFSEVPDSWTLDNELEIPRDPTLTPEKFTQLALRCIEKGASFYGGCCGVGPDYIRELNNALENKHLAL